MKKNITLEIRGFLRLLSFNVKSEKVNETQGAYIFYENNDPVYIGISRKSIRKLRNHFLGKSHFEARFGLSNA